MLRSISKRQIGKIYHCGIRDLVLTSETDGHWRLKEVVWVKNDIVIKSEYSKRLCCIFDFKQYRNLLSFKKC